MRKSGKLLLRFLIAAQILIPIAAVSSTFSNNKYTDVDAQISFGANYSVSSNFENAFAIENISASTGSASSFMQRIGSLAAYPKPSSVNDLRAVTFSSSSISLSWTSPSADSYRGKGNISRYIVKYSTIAPILSENAFANAFEYPQNWTPLEISAEETRIVSGFTPAATYYFIVKGINAHCIPSELSNIGYAFALVPLPPMNLRISASGNKVTLTWINPPGYAGKISFNDKANPAYPYEIMGYQRYRASAPLNEFWAFRGDTSSDTLNWGETIVDTSGEYFYYVKAFNKAGNSKPSEIRGNIANKLYFVSDDRTDLLEISESDALDFIGSSSEHEDFYTIEISSRSEDVKGRILKSVEFAAYKGGLEKKNNFKLRSQAVLSMAYAKNGDDFIPSSQPDYKRIGLYFYNGAKWLNLYGNVDETEKTIKINTSRVGKYQIRKVERLGSFAADASGLTNKMLTPNGDGKNDKMVFIFDNPRDSDIKGKIFDIKGAFVANMRPSEVQNSLEWDGKSNGRPVSGGVYIYQLEGEGQIFNGTVVVIK